MAVISNADKNARDWALSLQPKVRHAGIIKDGTILSGDLDRDQRIEAAKRGIQIMGSM